jgi:hypothetical protein
LFVMIPSVAGRDRRQPTGWLTAAPARDPGQVADLGDLSGRLKLDYNLTNK